MAGKPRNTKLNSKPRSRGRPSSYSSEIGLAICRQISAGKSLRSVCDKPGMPDRGTVLAWTTIHDDFCRRYAHAREERGCWFAEQALSICDSALRRDKDGRLDPGEVNQLRLRVDTRKWFASKLAPRQFGDRMQTELSGPDGGPVAFKLQAVDWNRLIARLKGEPDLEAALEAEPAPDASSGDA